MSEAKFMIDRVAEAIARIAIAQGVQWKDNNKLDFNTQARAAIEAMREPTPEMTEAMEPWTRVFGHQETVWKAGIDAVLK